MATEGELARLRNARVRDVVGERIGKVAEIFLEDRSQEISFITVSLGLFRTREVYIPYSLVDVSDEGAIVQVAAHVVREAPRATGTGYLTRIEEQELRRYYTEALSPGGRAGAEPLSPAP